MSRPKMQVVELDIYSWQGISIGATHYYGDLYCYQPEFKRIQIKLALTKKRAANINKKLSKNFSPDYARMLQAKPGQLDERFDTEEEVIEAAKAVWLQHFPNAKKLVEKNNNRKVYVRIGRTKL